VQEEIPTLTEVETVQMEHRGCLDQMGCVDQANGANRTNVHLEHISECGGSGHAEYTILRTPIRTCRSQHHRYQPTVSLNL
jgi:hypothetical protein